MTVLFVTGTGTGVGKTYCTVELVRAARARGIGVNALKPVISGYDPAAARGSDTAQLLGAVGLALGDESADRVSPWRFREPLSPDMAARREGRAIPFAGLVDFCRASAAAGARLTVVEGVGGVMVPLDDRHTVLDWIAELGWPVLLVAGSYLGTLSHTLTAAAALRERGCAIRAAVVCESAEQPAAPEETAAVLARFLAPLPIKVVPRNATHATTPKVFGELLELAGA